MHMQSQSGCDVERDAKMLRCDSCQSIHAYSFHQEKQQLNVIMLSTYTANSYKDYITISVSEA